MDLLYISKVLELLDSLTWFHLRGISLQHLLVSGRPKQFSAKIEKPFWYQFQYRPKQRNEFGIDQKEKNSEGLVNLESQIES